MLAEHIYRVDDVFVPGGIPELTYVNRAGGDLETQLANIRRGYTKMVTVTGSTKTGKSVLVNRIFPRDTGESIWIDGGTIKEENDLWSSVLAELPEPSSRETYSEAEDTVGARAGVASEANAVVVKAKIDGGVESSARKMDGQKVVSNVGSERVRAIRALRVAKIPLIIDDFHYLPRTFQGDVLRALKPLIFSGQAIIAIAIPHRRYDAIRVEREMTGRLEQITVAEWNAKELREIPQKGFPLLNLRASNSVNDRMVQEAYGSPHLMQEFCKQVCRRNGVTETVTPTKEIIHFDERLFNEVAEQTGRIVYEKLRKGPRQRTDRIQRELITGEQLDIYGVVLAALAALQPGLKRVEYEGIRGVIQDLVKKREHMPQRNEISRVLDKMSTIATSDESSVPVIDWDSEDGILHITDPFFAFYLKWGAGVETSSL
ncbi:hypothetical protein A3C20_04640 [Candidatus Kaiserbacteria bacterium RIFCSPHIGHO2_02_FULL_55_25]|uniref:Uncharacterized protein n=1 Tax=Candidatus Kaiserbacteria bacterium RIFCSPHIGHO2_02_FULL_55_25 TaxID=1798498 RepID=A0A1F6EAT6_9BACT|nr:MAG: hypothetical protein A3C20_04640 [Candidatus Kaiserbacteria bacterium RIFCSPHIGHO2_02_FULL_55_25]OGG77595.1 MAG: hypothetical protein A3F56_02645 [Candidatus Kaiserbacteria bacterium RIFCSPHIGHO2_12_FULL_55_13]OGG83429.1 MAG: hypothetical protein A3A42_04425 [Candidatus Kaiserbacteria bacterium RIFCSPLOWO2_01_FULL_55_25]